MSFAATSVRVEPRDRPPGAGAAARRRDRPTPDQLDPALRALLYGEDNPANLKLVEQLIARRPRMRLLSAPNATLGVELARDRRRRGIYIPVVGIGMDVTERMRRH